MQTGVIKHSHITEHNERFAQKETVKCDAIKRAKLQGLSHRSSFIAIKDPSSAFLFATNHMASQLQACNLPFHLLPKTLLSIVIKKLHQSNQKDLWGKITQTILLLNNASISCILSTLANGH